MVDAIPDLVRQALAARTLQGIHDPGLKPSAVLLLLYPKDGKYCVLFNKRTDEVEFNKGEICFPGGGVDPGDPNPTATALRETFEEMGISPDDVTILGQLDDTTTRAGFVMHPFVGTIPYPYQFKPSPIEVAEVLEVPISVLLDRLNVREEIRVQPDGQLARALTYVYGRHLIYGATARILHQFLVILKGTGIEETTSV